MSERRRTPRSSAATAPPVARVWRWPALILVLLAVVAGVLVQRHRDDQPVEAAAPSAGAFLPVASAPSALSSTWYCAGGTATGATDGAAEQTVQIANAGDRALTAHVTVVPSEGDSQTRDVGVPAQGRAELAVSSVLKAPFAAALVEVPGGDVAVSHELSGPTGRTTAACSSSPSASWYVPTGSTRPGTRQLVSVFNPFPSEAVLGLSFETDDGTRTPQKFEAVVVPGLRVVVLDITDVVTLRAQIATTVTVRSGRVIVDQIQTADGTNGTVKSLTVTPGAPQATSTWWFADGPAGEGVKTSIAVQNPSDRIADVAVQIRLDDASNSGAVEPFEAKVPARGYSLVDISGDGRVPQGIGYTAVVQARDGAAVVAARTVDSVAPASPTGRTVTLGSPALASSWLVPTAAGAEVAGSTVVVTNPSADSPVTVTVSTLVDGQKKAVAQGDGALIPAGGRGGFAIPSDKTAGMFVEVEATAPVVAETRVVFIEGGMAEPLAVPVEPGVDLATVGLPSTPPGQVVPSVPGADTAPGTSPDTGTASTGSSEPSPTSSSTSSSSTTPPAGGVQPGA